RLAGTNDAGEQVVQQVVPDLAPGFAAGPAERVRMFGAEDRPVRVVVEDDELGPPEEDDLSLRWQQHADDTAQALRPGLDRPERRGRPVEGTHSLAHFSTADEYGFGGGVFRPVGHSGLAIRILPHRGRGKGQAGGTGDVSGQGGKIATSTGAAPSTRTISGGASDTRNPRRPPLT